ncbi:DUF2231 domain-containing protein [Parapedobacter sp.]
MEAIINRQELWHPLSVHLPISFLLLATFLGVFLPFLRQGAWFRYLRYSMLFLMISGTMLLWVAFYTGNMAYGPVVRTICFPSKLKAHLYWGYVTCYSFSGITVFGLILEAWRKLGKRWPLAVVVVMCIAASICLSYTGHLGAELVYEQGAGVSPSAKDCD